MKIGNNDPAGQKESDAALEDMEDAVAACGQQKGCQVSTLLATYKRLLKLGADSEACRRGCRATRSIPTIRTPTTPAMSRSIPRVPQAAQAASLLDNHTPSLRHDGAVQPGRAGRRSAAG